MLRFVFRVQAANMMLVRCNPDGPISYACLTDVSDGPDHGIIGTTSLQDLESLQLDRQRAKEQPIRHLWRSVCFEDRAIDPNPMEYDGVARTVFPMLSTS